MYLYLLTYIYNVYVIYKFILTIFNWSKYLAIKPTD